MMLELPYRKELRALLLARWVRSANLEGVVAFSCGHATAALRDAGLYVVDLSPGGDLAPTRWWTTAEIRRAWPHLLDATSGHLTPDLMLGLGKAIDARENLLAGQTYRVPTGSGETIVALAMVRADCNFEPVYDCGPGTEFNDQAPLNALVKALCR